MQGFADKLKRLAPALVTASVELYQDVRANFLPTAAKFHYIFSLRELSAVFQGLSLARPESYMTSTVRLGRLWLHECFRVFSDRMASVSEVQRFTEMALEQVKKHLEDDPNELFATPLVCAGFLPGGASNSSSSSDGGASNCGRTTSRTRS
ncbi:hypothetical protein ATCC90586_010672 [Pythium insidiosum]|nr:hypothetical protein ATCC90586_010672 [Pythium insidiosum]